MRAPFVVLALIAAPFISGVAQAQQKGPDEAKCESAASFAGPSGSGNESGQHGQLGQHEGGAACPPLPPHPRLRLRPRPRRPRPRPPGLSFMASRSTT
jgi:hypothetical protein